MLPAAVAMSSARKSMVPVTGQLTLWRVSLKPWLLSASSTAEQRGLVSNAGSFAAYLGNRPGCRSGLLLVGDQRISISGPHANIFNHRRSTTAPAVEFSICHRDPGGPVICGPMN